MIDVKLLNKLLSGYFDSHVYSPRNNCYIGERILGSKVRVIIPKMKRTDAGNKFDCFVIQTPEPSKFETFTVNETLYTCIIGKDEMSLFSNNHEMLLAFVSDFLRQTREDFETMVGDVDLVGVVYPTMQPPGMEGEFIRQREDGNFEIRVYTDLTPIKENV